MCNQHSSRDTHTQLATCLCLVMRENAAAAAESLRALSRPHAMPRAHICMAFPSRSEMPALLPLPAWITRRSPLRHHSLQYYHASPRTFRLICMVDYSIYQDHSQSMHVSFLYMFHNSYCLVVNGSSSQGMYTYMRGVFRRLYMWSLDACGANTFLSTGDG
jgi:hypothetical protein